MKHYHTFTTLPPKRHTKTIEDVPGELLTDWSAKLLALMNLSWAYIDTICDLCIAMRLEPTKKLVRAIRTLRREYDRFRWPLTGPKFESEEAQWAEDVENLFQADFAKLFYSLSTETSKLGLTEDHKALVIAVQQALTLMDAVKAYARWCDKKIASFGVWVCDCCMVQTEFLKLYPLIPLFAGDCYNPDSQARTLTAQIIVNKLNRKIEFVHTDKTPKQ